MSCSLVHFPPSEFEQFEAHLRKAVGVSFLAFGYRPEEADRFLKLNAEPFDDCHYGLMEDGEIVSVAMRCGNLIEYVIPLDWDRRYEHVKALLALIQELHPGLWFSIREDLPSHGSWYAGLLPSLGFSMTPRVRMTAEQSRLLALSVPEDMEGYQVLPMESRWLEECNSFYREAFNLSPDGAVEMARNITESLEQPDRLDSWRVAFHGSELVGSCFASHHRKRLFIEELAVAKTHRKRGLGRRLLLESFHRVSASFPDADSVVLAVDRANGSAVGLYRSLGFLPDENYTTARMS